MRVISGQKKGKKLARPKVDSIRPTTDKVKESIFNIIQFELMNSDFLDLFAGSGQIGIEALSRGAKRTTFIDKNKISINIIKKNLNAADLAKEATVINMDSIAFLKTSKNLFDIAFLDPPYNSEVLNSAMFYVQQIMKKNGIIICEHLLSVKMPDKVNNFLLSKMYKYGKIAISVYRRNL